MELTSRIEALKAIFVDPKPTTISDAARLVDAIMILGAKQYCREKGIPYKPSRAHKAKVNA